MTCMNLAFRIAQIPVVTGGKPSLWRRLALTILLAGLAGCGSAGAPSVPESELHSAGPLVERDVGVAMRDGVMLRADVYRPAGPGPFPVLVYRTPYGKAAAAESYDTHLGAVERGYAVVLQDVRGRNASDGLFDPYRNEGKDGYDTIEWAASRSWSNGSIGTFGLSYPGAVQWLAALESPPHLVAMAPAMTFSSPRNFFYMNGIFDLSWLPWIYVNIAPDARARLDLPGIRSSEEAAESWSSVAGEYRAWLPLAGLPYLRAEAPYYFEWLRHPPEDSWWDWAEIRGRYSEVDAAVLNLSGWHDEAYGPEGAVTNFTALQEARKSEARKFNEPRGNHLILGPWTHGVFSTMSRTAGDVDFGPAAAIDYNAEILDFFDHYLRGIDNGFATEDPVRYFVMGENRWDGAMHWPPGNARFHSLFLTADTNGVPRLSAKPVPRGASASSTFRADPDDPVMDPYDSFGPHDYRSLARRQDVLAFDSESLTEELRVVGAIEAVVYASCDCRDFDLWLRIFDVHPDGRAINLMSPGNDVLRASYRDAAEGRRLLEPGRIYELRLENLLTGILIPAGHRVRVQVSASFAPHFSRNLQTGASEITESASRPARISIHHDSEHRSRMRLPVIERQQLGQSAD